MPVQHRSSPCPKRWLLTILLGLVLTGCGTFPARLRHPLETPGGFRQEGMASWYGKQFHGRQTANGETYDMDGLTAAHRTLPLGVWADVIRLDTGRRVRVWINDRGPFVKGRIIDLSRGAARKIGMLEAGVARVRVIVSSRQMKLAQSRLTVRTLYTLQIGSFTVQANAQRLRDRLQDRYGQVYITKYETRSRAYYRVRVGKFSDPQRADAVARRLEDEGFDPLLTVR